MTGTAAPALDAAAVTAVLRRHLGAAATCVSIGRAASGNSQETWLLQVDGVPGTSSLVLRRTAAAGTLEWSDRAVEVAVLDAAADAGLPVPRVHWWEPDGNDLERAYVVMDRADGAAPDLRRPEVRTALAIDLGHWLARLHADVDAPALLANDTTSQEATRSQLAHWTERARTSGMTPPLAAALLGWLGSTLPDDGADPVLVWGDPGPHNVLTDDSGRITALLDWELAHVGHPLSDLGAARWSCLGHLDREALTVAYERALDVDVDREIVDWFEVLACVTRSVMLFDGVRAAVDGRAHDPNVAALGLAMVSANLVRAATIAWGLDAGTAHDEPVDAGLRPDPSEQAAIVARFLRASAVPATEDARVRRGLKIAAALLDTGAATSRDDAAPGDGWSWFERGGHLTDDDRRRLVAGMVRERSRHRALLDLYGDTTSV